MGLDSRELVDRALQRRAVEAAIWGMPLVNTDAMRQAYFRDVGAKYNDICYFSKPADWKFQVTTPNASTNYVYFNYNLKDGPVVVEIPAAVGAGLLGSMVNAWDEPMADVGPAGEDQGKGGRYLLLPPDFKGETPAGYFPVRYPTYNGYALYRAIRAGPTDADVAAALALVKKLRVYPLAQQANPPEQRFIDIHSKTFDGIADFDERFFDRLNRMVQEEPVLPRDLAVMGMLKSIGIEKGKDFKPTAATQSILKSAAQEAQAAGDRATVIDSSGKVLADSESDPRSMENHAQRPEFRAALGGNLGVDQRSSQTLGIPFLYVAAPVSGGAVRLAYSLAEIETTTEQLGKALVWGSLIAFGAAMLTAGVASHYVARRLVRIVDFAERVAAGDLTARIASTSSDEIGQVAAALDKTTRRIQESFEHVQTSQHELETLLNSIPNGVIAVTADRVLLWANRAMKSLEPQIRTGAPVVESFRDPALLEALRKSIQESKMQSVHAAMLVPGKTFNGNVCHQCSPATGERISSVEHARLIETNH